MDLKRIPTKGLITNVEMDLSKFIEKFTKVGIIYSLTELLLGLAMFTGFFYMSFENVKEEAPFNQISDTSLYQSISKKLIKKLLQNLWGQLL